jgi:hypothetical protein
MKFTMGQNKKIPTQSNFVLRGFSLDEMWRVVVQKSQNLRICNGNGQHQIILLYEKLTNP